MSFVELRATNMKCTGIMKCIQEASLQRNNERTEEKKTIETNTKENMQQMTCRATCEGKVFGEFLLFIVCAHVRSIAATSKRAFIFNVRKNSIPFILNSINGHISG